MNKLVLTEVSILVFIFVFLSLLSLKGNYGAEQQLWGIDRKFGNIASHEESTPDYAIDQLAGRYRAFIRKYNGSMYATRAQLMLGNLYALIKSYAQARLEYKNAIGPDMELSAQAEIGIAKTYESEERWDIALAVYREVMQKYPLTPSGFSVPMYLTSHVVTTEDQKDYTDRAYTDALAFYQGIAIKNPKSIFEYNALRMIVLCQLNLKDWSGTVKTMGELMLKYPTGKNLQEAVKAINLLCVTKLHDYGLAISIYQRFIQQYPNYPSDGVFKKMINDLQLLKDKKLIIKTVPRSTSQ